MIPLPVRGPTALLAAALAAASPTAAWARQALLSAPLDPGHAHAVAVCQGQGACTIDSPNCSGTLVAPNLVLTARHCVDFGRQLAETFCDATFLGIISTGETLVTVDPDPYAPGATPDWIVAARVLVPEDARVCAGDLALIVLSRSVPGAVATPAWVDLETNLATARTAEVAMVARGWLDATLTCSAPGACTPEVVDDGGLRRRVLEHVPVLCASDRDGACSLEDSSDPSGLFSAAADTVLVGGSALPGDSGGGILDQDSFTAGVPRVVAVSSFGTWDGAGRPNGTGGVRVARQRAFLLAGAREAAALAGAPPPDWAVHAGGATAGGAGCSTSPGRGAPGSGLLPLLAAAAWLARPRTTRRAPARARAGRPRGRAGAAARPATWRPPPPSRGGRPGPPAARAPGPRSGT